MLTPASSTWPTRHLLSLSATPMPQLEIWQAFGVHGPGLPGPRPQGACQRRHHPAIGQSLAGAPSGSRALTHMFLCEYRLGPGDLIFAESQYEDQALLTTPCALQPTTFGGISRPVRQAVTVRCSTPRSRVLPDTVELALAVRPGQARGPSRSGRRRRFPCPLHARRCLPRSNYHESNDAGVAPGPPRHLQARPVRLQVLPYRPGQVNARRNPIPSRS